MSAAAEPPVGYRPLGEPDLPAYLAAVPALRDRIGGDPGGWSVREVGDGNLNLVFLVKGAAGGVAVKQALPYVRLVGESWPLPLSRAHYEHMALVEQGRLAPGLVPEVIHHDPDLALTVLELLEPHTILRQGLIAGTLYPRLADDIGTFMARTLFTTSALALPAAELKARIAAFAGNVALCRITEDLVFTEPYFEAPQNRWTSPWLDGMAAEVRADLDLHVTVSRLKLAFLTRAEALIHGDLHTGSFMVTPEDTRAIDPEFAFYGPMGFDVGAILANLLMAYLSQEGHERSPGERLEYGEWILATTEAVWSRFRSAFLDLWRAQPGSDAYPAPLFPGEAGAARLEAERQAYVDRLFTDAVGFAGAKTIRRILGLAHNADFELIADPRRRATCEARALRLGRDLVVDAGSYGSIAAVTDAARRLRGWVPDFG